MKTLVVYYSRTGTTKKLAEDLARALNADIEEITDLKNRQGPVGWVTAGKDAFKEELTQIKDTSSPSKYDLVLLGTPVWAGNMTPALRTYVRCHKDKLGNVACFCTNGGASPGKTFENMKKILKNDLISTLSLSTKEVSSGIHGEKVKDFASKIKVHFKNKK